MRGSLAWQIAPDDFSTNSVEALIANVEPGNALGTLTLTVPGGTARIGQMMPAGQASIIRCNGNRVGLVIRFANAGGRARLRLSLGRTGYRDGVAPLPHGTWGLSTLADERTDCWILRDDADRVLDRALPSRPSWFDDLLYRDLDGNGAPPLGDDPGSTVLRSGTLSVLATAIRPDVVQVQATERCGSGPVVQAWYSGRRDDGQPVAVSQLVDDGWPSRGVACAANGTFRRTRISGSSAAVALQARAMIGLL